MALHTIARWVVLGALFLIPFLPLYVAGDMFFPFITSKGFAFRILIGLAAGAWILLAIADRKYRPQFSWTLVLYGGFVAWMLLADLFAVNAHKALWSNFERMDGWISLIHAFLFFLVAGSVLSKERLWNKWWLTVLGGSVLVSLHGLWQIFGFADIHQGGARVDANFGNAIYLAAYLLFTVGIALWQATIHRGWLRYLLVTLAALQVILIFFTATRGVILGLFIAALLCAFAWLTVGEKGKKGRTIAASALVILALLGGGLYLARDTSFVKEEPTLTRLASIFHASEFQVRFTLWSMALEGFVKRPVFGYGQEGFLYVFTEQYQPSLYAQEPWFDRVHNTYLDWLVAGGIPALLLFIGMLGAALRAFFMTPAKKEEQLLLAGIVAAYAFQAVTAFDNLFTYILFAAMLAMAHERTARPLALFEKAREPSAMAVGAIVTPFLLVVTVVLVWTLNMPSIEASKDLIKAAQSSDPTVGVAQYTSAAARGSFAGQEIAEQMVTYLSRMVPQPSIPLPLKEQMAVLALTTMKHEVDTAPQDVRIRLLYSQGLRAAGDREGYLREVSVARTLSPKKQTILLQLGTDLWQMGDRAGAARVFEEAYTLETSNKLAASYAAAGRIITGDTAGGKALLMEVFGTLAVDEEPVRFAYYEARMYDELIAATLARVEKEGGSVSSRFLLARTYAATGHLDKAREEIDSVLREHPASASEVNALLVELGFQ
ncbi:MAG: O-antigen ligase family protein [Minisyncoccia bacterium]